MNITALAGGVGGAKLVDGLAQILPPDNFTVIVNTGDDFEHFGLKISPDLDTILYTLAGKANPIQGWGRENETWKVMSELKRLGGPDWFNLGDLDLALHLERTRMLNEGKSLSEITQTLSDNLSVKQKILPMSDQPVPTIVLSGEDEYSFQEYFVKLKCLPKVDGFRYENASNTEPAPGVLKAINEADLVIFCPSNPWVSLDPILAVSGTRKALSGKLIVGVSPIIQGETIKGPAAKMTKELGIEPSAYAVADHYRHLLTGFVIDITDVELETEICSLGIDCFSTQTIMRNRLDRRNLAEEVVNYGVKLIKRR